MPLFPLKIELENNELPYKYIPAELFTPLE